MGRTTSLVLAGVLLLAGASCSEDSRSAPEPTRIDTVNQPPTDPAESSPDLRPPDSPRATAQSLLVSGIFDQAGGELLRLNPVVVVPGEARPLVDGTRGIFVLVVTYTDGRTSRVPFDALIAADSEAGTTEHGFFEVSVQLDGEVAEVRILGTGDSSMVEEVPIDGITD